MSMLDYWTGNGIRSMVRDLCHNSVEIINCMSTATAQCPNTAYIRTRVERMYNFCGSDSWFANDVAPVLGDAHDMFRQPGCGAVFGDFEWAKEHPHVTSTMSVWEGIVVNERYMRTLFDSLLIHFRRKLAIAKGCTVPLRDIFVSMMFKKITAMELGSYLNRDMQTEISAIMAE